MLKAFVFGKFLPFHKGHQSMIEFALAQCDFLTVLVCESDQEKLSGSIRKKWIEKTFADTANLEVKVLEYYESELPNTSVSSREVSKLWASAFSNLLVDHQLVITSEQYGEFVAQFMGINHISFDLDKNMIPISATDIRQNFLKHWEYLPNSVRADIALTIVVLGTESTGKSTLTEQLAAHFGGTLVTEVGRELIDNSNSFEFEDLLEVAQLHAQRIESAKVNHSPIVIVDTDIHITKSYSRFVFGKDLEVDSQVYNSNRAHLYLYLNNDVEYVQDGSRLNKTDRNLLDTSHRKILSDHSIEFVEIRGNWAERLTKSIHEIDRLIQQQSQKNWK